MNKIICLSRRPSGVVPTPGERDALAGTRVRPYEGRAVIAGQAPDTTKCVPSASRVPFMIGTHPQGRTQGRTYSCTSEPISMIFDEHDQGRTGTQRSKHGDAQK